MRSRSTAWRGVVTLAILVGGPAPARAGFTIMDLGKFNPSASSGAMAISANGGTAGMITLPGGDVVAASSQAGGTLRQVSAPPGATTSIANAINDGGTVAGNYTDSKGHQLGFYTSGGVATSIGPLTNASGASGTSTQANGINDSNQVVGTGNVPSVVGHRAFVSSGGVLTMIGPLGGGDPAISALSNWGNGINNKGMVVGTSELVAGGVQNAFYTVGVGGPAMDLTTRNPAGNFQGNTAGQAIDTNGDIVGSGDVGGSQHGFFASNVSGSTLVDLGTLGNASSSKALGVNDDALVVGASGGRAFLWGGPEGMYDLNSLIPAADEANWVLTQATGINDSCQISGEGYIGGVLHGFLLTPIPGQSLFTLPGTVPTPPALVLSAIGLAVAGGWSRRRLRRGRSGGRAGA